MRAPLRFPGGQYPVALPTGEWAAMFPGSHLQTHLGLLLRPFGDGQQFDLLELEITNVGGFKIVGKAQAEMWHAHRGTWEWAEATGIWRHVSTEAHGTYAAIYDTAGRVVLATPAGNGSQGWRYVTEDGTLVTGDDTLNADRRVGVALGLRDFWEYTYLGGVTIGQGETGCDVLIDGVRRRLEDGDTHTIRVKYDRPSDRWAVSTTKWRQREAVIYPELTRADLRALPVVAEPPVPVPVPPIPEPPPMSLIAPNIEAEVAKQIRLHPEVNTRDEVARGKILDYVCEAKGGKPWGRKARKSDGSNKNTDGLTYLRLDGLFEIYDVIDGTSGGASWEGYGPFRQGENGWWAPHEPVDGPTPVPVPVPPSPQPCNCTAELEALKRLIRDLTEAQHAIRTDATTAKAKAEEALALAQQPRPVDPSSLKIVAASDAPPLSTSRGILGHSHTINLKIVKG